MVTEIGVHDDHEISSCKLKTVNIGCSETEFASSGLEDDVVGAPYFLELFCDFLGAIGGSVVNDDDFPVEVSNRDSKQLIHNLLIARIAHCSRNVFSISQQMMGRFFRSL